MSCLSSCLGRVRAGLGLWCISVPSWLGRECLLGVRLWHLRVAVCRVGARWRAGASRELRPGHGFALWRRENRGRGAPGGARCRAEGPSRRAGRALAADSATPRPITVPWLRFPQRRGWLTVPWLRFPQRRGWLTVPRSGIPQRRGLPPRAPVPNPATPRPVTVPQPGKPQRPRQCRERARYRSSAVRISCGMSSAFSRTTRRYASSRSLR